MKFAVITYISHNIYQDRFYSYSPYVDEMNLWLKNVDDFLLLAPANYQVPLDSEKPYNKKPNFTEVPSVEFTGPGVALKSFLLLPSIILKIFRICKKAEHIHLRCPGNISLLGCIVQIFFPKKPKTVKYAGNWDPDSAQPWSYRFQKWILSNTFLSRNIKVLSYGNWENQTANIVPFFTASYSKKDIRTSKRNYSKVLKFIFVGSLSPGKQPFFAIKMVEYLLRNGKKASLKIYGTGILREELQNYIDNSEFSNALRLEGFSKKEHLKDIYLDSHFLILPSKSEGWPKAVAEAMFFGCIPIATSVSCVPWMLDYGNRGFILPENFELEKENFIKSLSCGLTLENMSGNAQEWSQQYTIEKFENEIKKLL